VRLLRGLRPRWALCAPRPSHGHAERPGRHTAVPSRCATQTHAHALPKAYFLLCKARSRPEHKAERARSQQKNKKEMTKVRAKKGFSHTSKRKQFLICIMRCATLYFFCSALRTSGIVHNPGHYKSFAGHNEKRKSILTSRKRKLKIRGGGLYLCISLPRWDGSPLDCRSL
jgi:hypothetical protein